MAHEGGEAVRASELASRAEKLTRSPLIDAADRDDLLRRMETRSGM